MAKKIVIIGGGSKGWTPKLVKDMLLTTSLSDSTFVLYDIKKTESDLVERFLTKLNDEHLKTGATIESTDEKAKAFDGADYFIITISTGGLEATRSDIEIPEQYGIFHTVGDTSGPGGWARTIRNFGPIFSLASDINTYAPGAVVLNYSNPMTTLTSILSKTCTGPVVGLCHGLFQNLGFLKALYRLENESDISVSYAGLNHFYWITELKAKGKNLFTDIKQRVLDSGFTKLLAEVQDIYKDPMGHMPVRELATALFRETGFMPYMGDRHTCEFFPCYITSEANMETYRLVRTSMDDRAKKLRARDEELRKMIDGNIPSEYCRQSRETASDIIAAHSEGTPFIDVGNVPNKGQIANLPLGTVVETAVLVDRNGFSPITFGPLPDPLLQMVLPYAHVFNLTVQACFDGNRELALQALQMDPVCSHLTGGEVRELGERLIQPHKPFITCF